LIESDDFGLQVFVDQLNRFGEQLEPSLHPLNDGIDVAPCFRVHGGVFLTRSGVHARIFLTRSGVHARIFLTRSGVHARIFLTRSRVHGGIFLTRFRILRAHRLKQAFQLVISHDAIPLR
jgi:hypothetical protein